MKNLYISDADFTLLNSNSYLSTYSANLIRKFFDYDIKFSIATARSIYSLRLKIGKIPLHLPIIEFNGAYITDLNTNKPELIQNMEKSLVQKIYSKGKELNLFPIISTYNNKQRFYPPPVTNRGIRKYLQQKRKNNDPRRQKATYLYEIEDPFIVSMTYIGLETEIKQLLDMLDKNTRNKISFHFYENKYTPGWFWLSIQNKVSTKENAIMEIVKRYELDDHQLFVFGDDVNDIGMMRKADVAVAVENAKDEVKNIADEIIDTNDQNSVVQYIKKKEEITQ